MRAARPPGRPTAGGERSEVGGAAPAANIDGHPVAFEITPA